LDINPRFILHGVSTTDFIGTIVSEYYFSGEIQKKININRNIVLVLSN